MKLLFLLLELLALLIAGCAAHAIADNEDKSEPEPAPIVDDGQPAPDSAGSSVPLKVSAPASVVATIFEALGDSGTLTLTGEARKIVRDDVTLNLPTETKADYSLTDEGGTITFAKPLPTVTAKIFAGIKVSPSLTKIELNSDDTMTAHVKSLFGTHKRTFPLGWQTEESLAPQTTPTTRCQCGCNREGCQCGRAASLAGCSSLTPPPELAQVEATPLQYKRAQNRERENRGVMITADWCPPCIPVTRDEIPKLERSGWLINKGPQSHLLVLDYDTDSKAIEALKQLPHAAGVKSPTSLPAFLRIQSNQITGIHEGAMDAAQIARFVYPSLAASQAAAAGENTAKPVTGGQQRQPCPKCGKYH